MEEFMSDEILANLEKHMEGNQLALAAVAEVLTKMDARLLKEEEDSEEEEMEKAAEAQQDALVKSVANSVIAALKADQGMDVDGEKTRSASQGPSGQADEEKPASPTTKIEDQQATIQAMKKAEDDEDEDDVEKAGYKAEDEDEKEENEVEKAKAVDEDEDEDVEKAKGDEDDDELAAMKKELDALRKQIGDAEANIEKAVQEESENRLRKMGFREETSLVAPKLTHPLGTDGTTPIVKGDNPANTVDQLASLSYKELRELQQKIELGETDGVPRELIGK
jgi:hypothetical protein